MAIPCLRQRTEPGLQAIWLFLSAVIFRGIPLHDGAGWAFTRMGFGAPRFVQREHKVNKLCASLMTRCCVTFDGQAVGCIGHRRKGAENCGSLYLIFKLDYLRSH